jgi:hypothetical protein
MTENRGAEQDVTSLRQEEKPQEHTKSVQGEVQLIDMSLLMGDPFYFSRSILWSETLLWRSNT